ncbi:hypothetical protein STEG23_030928 [Scotinomys teguina]
MMGACPHRATANGLPILAPQPEGSNPAKRRCLHECSNPGSFAQPDLRVPTVQASEQPTTMLFQPAGCTLTYHLEDLDLLLEPDPTQVRQVTLPGHTIIVVPEEFQDSAQPGQPGFCPANQHDAALLPVPQDYPVVLHQRSSSASASDIQGMRNASDTDEEPKGGRGGFLMPMPWMDAPAGMVPGPLLPFTAMKRPLFQGQVSSPWNPLTSPGARRYAPSSTWSLQGSMLGHHRPGSPLQSLPPSPPPSPPRPPGHQAQGPQSRQKLWRPRSKARRRLFQERKYCSLDRQHLGRSPAYPSIPRAAPNTK